MKKSNFGALKKTAAYKHWKDTQTKLINVQKVSSDKIASCSFDKTFKIWDITTGEFIKTIPNETCLFQAFKSG